MDELDARQRLKDDFIYYARNCLRILTKTGGVEPFVLNKAQLYIHERLEAQLRETGKIRAIILKGRQQGCSTLVEGRYYWKVTHCMGKKAYILTHEDKATQNLFKMVSRYHDNCPVFMRPATGSNNANELFFDKLDSGYNVGTAGSKGTGRSSTVHFFHGSEVAFWNNAETHATGVMQAIPSGTMSEGTEVILESTAEGMGNYFHQTWQDAEAGNSEYQAIFVPWMWQEEYRSLRVPENFSLSEDEQEYARLYTVDDAQMHWRRMKIAEFKGDITQFDQEYPATAAIAFRMSTQNSYISPATVLKARKYHITDVIRGAKVMGLDPAHGGDRTSFCLRQGRKVHWVQSFQTEDHNLTARLCADFIDKESVVMVFIDIGGTGSGVYDILRGMGYGDKITGVNFGETKTLLRPELFVDKKSEMYGSMKEWFEDDVQVDIPDSDALHMDICSMQREYQGHTRLKMKSKADMRKQGLRSPDEADALALTFAFPVQEKLYSKSIIYNDQAWV